jgi:hypothetical protein
MGNNTQSRMDESNINVDVVMCIVCIFCVARRNSEQKNTITMKRESVVTYQDQTVRDIYEKLKKKHGQNLDFVRESSSEHSGSESDSTSSTIKVRKPSTTRASVDQRSMMISMNRPSILSTEYTDTHPVSYKGFINLALTMLVVSHLRLIVENAKKYGLLVNTFANLVEFVTDPSSFPSLQLASSFHLWIIAAYLIERLLASMTGKRLIQFRKQNEKLLKSLKRKSSSASSTSSTSTSSSSSETAERRDNILKLWSQDISRIQYVSLVSHTVLIVSLLAIPIKVIFTVSIHPVSSIVNCALQTILFMKLVSYAAVNAGLRNVAIVSQSKKNLNRYPQNISLQNLYYFICAPTLVYEENFVRSKEIRYSFLAKRILEFILFTIVMVVVVEQYIVPLVKNSMRPLKENDFVGVFERLLKLTIPNIVVWVLMFYTFFHSFLNIVAEILRYGDRLFYLEWWNSTTMSYFWVCEYIANY